MNRRDAAVALAALFVITALAWFWIAALDRQMQAMDMPDMAGMSMSHMQMMAPSLAPWTLSLGLYLFVMWTVMMVGMMTPTAAPMVLVYLRVANQAAGSDHRFASAAWLFTGYLLAWTLFSAVATLAQWLLESAALMTPQMQAASRPLGGVVLLLAGLYQWLPLKDACLSRCRAPRQFIQQHGGFQQKALPSLRLGLLHGLYCVGCCGVLMALLFVVGVMNLLWIAVLMAFVLIEKLAPRVRTFSRAAGVLLVGAGLWVLMR